MAKHSASFCSPRMRLQDEIASLCQIAFPAIVARWRSHHRTRACFLVRIWTITRVVPTFGFGSSRIAFWKITCPVRTTRDPSHSQNPFQHTQLCHPNLGHGPDTRPGRKPGPEAGSQPILEGYEPDDLWSSTRMRIPTSSTRSASCCCTVATTNTPLVAPTPITNAPHVSNQFDTSNGELGQYLGTY